MNIWSDGALRDQSYCVLDKDLWPLGSGIFETLRTSGTQIYAFERHMRRAVDGANKLGLRLPGEEEIRSAIKELLQSEHHEVGRLRLTFSDQGFVATHIGYTEQLKPMEVKVMMEPLSSLDPTIKTYPYSYRTDLLHGLDEVILVKDGVLTEGAVSNLIFLIDYDWFTTPITAGILPGVVRALAIEKAGVKVRNIAENEIGNIQSAIAISSLKIAKAISKIDERPLDTGIYCQELVSHIRAIYQPGSVG